MKRTTKLSDVLSAYLDRQFNLRPSSAQQLKCSLNALERNRGEGVTLGQCSAAFLCAWIRERMETCSKRTAKRNRCDILTLIRFAKRERAIREVPDVPVVKVDRKMPQAWTVPEVGKLIAGALTLKGSMGDLPISKSWWFASLLLFLYDGGSRVRSAISLKTADVFLDRGTALLRADSDKTWSDRIITLSPQLVAMLREGKIASRELVWPYPYNLRRLWLQMNQVLKAAGLPVGREFKFHRLRRTHATQAVIVAGWDAARRSLGHSSEQMTKVYVDQSQVQESETGRIILPRPSFANAGGAV